MLPRREQGRRDRDMENKRETTVKTEKRKNYKEVVIEAKNSPCGSYAAGCPETYGDPDGENCYICDYGG